MERGVYMCICVCICANNMQILGFGGVGGLGVGGGYHWGGRGGGVGVRGPGSYIIVILHRRILLIYLEITHVMMKVYPLVI